MRDGRGWSIAEGLLWLLCAAVILWVGLTVRREAWNRTEVLRFPPDMQNAWEWGSRASAEGLFTLYDDLAASRPRGNYRLDYLPLRLSVMKLWADSRLKADPPPRAWQLGYDFNAPLLHFNSFCEATAAVGVGLLAFDFSRRDRRLTLFGHNRPLYGIWLALIAATVAWLNPASIVSAHARPTWDVWVTPFYLWAVWLATRQYWFVAGLVLGTGTLFKGQLLFAVPLFILWPMMRLQLAETAKVALGFGLGILAIGLPSTVGPTAKIIAFDAGLILIPVVVVALLWLLRNRLPRGIRPVPFRWLMWLVPTAGFLALIGNIVLFDGSLNWLRIGLVYGAEKFPELEVGGSLSLTGILSREYGWEADDLVEPLQWLRPGVTISHLLAAFYAVGLLAIAWCMVRTERYGRRGFLLAAAAPWILYFAIFPKMHERYLLWGAVVACAGVAVNAGMLGLAIFFSLCSAVMSLRQMSVSYRMTGGGGLFTSRQNLPYQIGDYLDPTFPGLGWAVLLATAVWLWVTVASALAARPRSRGEASVVLPIGASERTILPPPTASSRMPNSPRRG